RKAIGCRWRFRKKRRTSRGYRNGATAIVGEGILVFSDVEQEVVALADARRARALRRADLPEFDRGRAVRLYFVLSGAFLRLVGRRVGLRGRFCGHRRLRLGGLGHDIILEFALGRARLARGLRLGPRGGPGRAAALLHFLDFPDGVVKHRLRRFRFLARALRQLLRFFRRLAGDLILHLRLLRFFFGGSRLALGILGLGERDLGLGARLLGGIFGIGGLHEGPLSRSSGLGERVLG